MNLTLSNESRMELGLPERSGMALLIVLVLIVMVALSAYGFTLLMQSQYRLSRVQEDQVQAKLAALSGVDLVAALLKLPPASRGELGDVTNNPKMFQAVAVEEVARNSTGNSSSWKFSVISPGSLVGEETSSSGLQEGSAPQNLVFGLQSESSKIHLPTLAEWERKQPGLARGVLMSLPGATQELVDAWLNRLTELSPSQPMNRNANQGTGLTDIPGRASPFITATSSSNIADHKSLQSAWYGDDLNHNYRLDLLEISLRAVMQAGDRGDAGGLASFTPSAQLSSGSASTQIADNILGWQQYLTWHSGSRNESMAGRPRIFLNSPNLQELHQQLLEIWPPEWVNFVIAYRQYGPAAASRTRSRRSNRATDSLAESTPAGNEQVDSAPDLSVPASFSITTPLELVGSIVRIPQNPAVERSNSRNRTLRSPFRDEIAAASDYLNRLLDDVTIDFGPRCVGRIDVDGAPLLVLLAVPGMEKELAERIVQQRQGSSQSDLAAGNPSDNPPGGRTIAWLYEQGLVDLPQLILLEPYLTTRSDVYSCQIVGHKDENHAVYRATMTIDACGSEPVIRNYRTWHDWDRGFDVSQFLSVNDQATK